MATRKSRTRRADRHGHAAPVVDQSAACDAGRHARCRGEVLSLLAPVGTACGCSCHLVPVPTTWKGGEAA